MKAIWNFLKEEDGVTAIEYGLIAGLIAVVIIASLQLAGGSLKTIFAEIARVLGLAAAGTTS